MKSVSRNKVNNDFLCIVNFGIFIFSLVCYQLYKILLKYNKYACVCPPGLSGYLHSLYPIRLPFK